MKKLNRRQLIQNGVKLGGASLLSPFLQLNWAQGQAAEPHFLLILRCNGGWDTPMFTDSHKISDIESSGLSDYEYGFRSARAPMKEFKHALLGAAMQPLFPHLQDLSIINGMMMLHKSSIHEINRYYSVSGTTDLSAGMIPIQLAKVISAQQKAKVAFNLEYEDFPLAGYSEVENLAAMSGSTATNSSDEFSQDLEKLVQHLAMSDSRTNHYMSAMNRKLMNEASTLTKYESLRPLLESKLNPNRKEMVHVARALAGLASGHVQYSLVDFIRDAELDSHSGHIEKQTQNLTLCAQQIADIIKVMKETVYLGSAGSGNEKSLFDLTTVAVTGEFYRTPGGSTGSEHNQFNNSMIMFGKNIRGNSVIGRSNVYSAKMLKSSQSSLKAVPYDFRKKQSVSLDEEKQILARQLDISVCARDSCIAYIKPEIVWRTLMRSFGVTLPVLGSGLELSQLIKT